MSEAGYPDFAIRDWQGIVVKTGTPRAVVERLNAALRKALVTDELKTSFAVFGAEPVAGSPQEFTNIIVSDTIKMGRIARTANIRID